MAKTATIRMDKEDVSRQQAVIEAAARARHWREQGGIAAQLNFHAAWGDLCAALDAAGVRLDGQARAWLAVPERMDNLSDGLLQAIAAERVSEADEARRAALAAQPERTSAERFELETLTGAANRTALRTSRAAALLAARHVD